MLRDNFARLCKQKLNLKVKCWLLLLARQLGGRKEPAVLTSVFGGPQRFRGTLRYATASLCARLYTSVHYWSTVGNGIVIHTF